MTRRACVRAAVGSTRACAGDCWLAGRPGPPCPPAPARAVDPVTLFEQLDREIMAARTLVALTQPGEERRRAALDALALARDVLADAADLFSHPAPGPVTVSRDQLDGTPPGLLDELWAATRRAERGQQR